MRLILLFSFCAYATCSVEDYEKERIKYMKEEFKLTLGGDIYLTEKENKVNDCLMKYKRYELEYAFKHPEYFNLSHHYFSYKEKMKNSKVYKIIKDLPKGAALHVHDMGILGPDYLVNITYMEHLYVCLADDLQLKFSNAVPKTPCSVPWKFMSDVRSASGDVAKFDANLRKQFTLVVDNPDEAYPSITASWTAFMKYFIKVAPLLSYRPVWEQYFYDVLKKFREDNVMYVEVRTVLPNLYELDGTTYEQLVTAKSYRKAIKRFTKDYPDFGGAKIIFAPMRKVDNTTVHDYITLAKLIKTNLPEYFAGFDLVGQEDLGRPLKDFVPQLLDASKDLNYFFHAGETDWYGELTDENLVDAILLGAKRIGHAYALPKHPYLTNAVVQKDIGLEVNVISNSVLSLVRDIRNHPLSIFLSQNLPVVLSSDDPGVWEADPLTDDYYVAFVGVASKHSDLRMLKRLALNSLKYSGLDPEKKAVALTMLKRQWVEFANNFMCSSY